VWGYSEKGKTIVTRYNLAYINPAIYRENSWQLAVGSRQSAVNVRPIFIPGVGAPAMNIYDGDNGRVLGYDNAHGYHHRHYMGRVEPFEFESYTSVLDKFQEEWQDLMKRKREKRP
jgi:hypothetical protein